MTIRNSKWGTLTAALLLMGGAAMAQDPAPGTTTTPSTTSKPADKPSVAQRKENQQDRIANGIDSGQLTAGETKNLEKKEAAINSETRADRAANGGKLTATEKKQINHQQNQMSQQIYNDKHNANTAHYGNNKVDQRQQNQQDRIAQGVKSGQLTAGETAKLEGQEKAIHQQAKTEREINGGKLSQGEKAQINKEQNQESQKIYNKKHNAKTQAKPKK